MMRQLVIAGALLWQGLDAGRDPAPIAQPEHMRYMRAVRTTGGAGQTCALLDAQTFPHAAPSLADLRLFPAAPSAHEVPYAVTMSEAVSEETQTARVLNLGTEPGGSGERIAFDLEMPARAYSSVVLQLAPAVHDYLATAAVTGMDSLSAPPGARLLGTFTLFDLESQHLSHDTTLRLAESTFRYLHVVLSVASAPGRQSGAMQLGPRLIEGAEVPPSREAQILYTTVATTNSIETVGRESRASLDVPLRVPIERVTVELAPGFTGNFSRDLRVTATTNPPAKGEAEDERRAYPEQLSGSILRVHANEAGREIRTEQLSVPAVLGANLQRGAKVEIAIENGDDQPLPIAAVRLEMRQREVCFDASAAKDGLHLYYGDERLDAPVYDYARLFQASAGAAATLGPEQENPQYRKPAETRSFAERHPEVLWIALLVVICVLGAVAVTAAKNVGTERRG